MGPKTAAHIAEFCDGWLPLGDAHSIDSGLTKIRDACIKIDRDPAGIRLSMFYPRGANAEDLKVHSDLGAVRGILPLPSEGADVVLPLLDKYTALIRG